MKTQTQPEAKDLWNARSGHKARVLQRKCACGGAAGAGGECEECRKKLQRQARDGSGPVAVPTIVHEVLRSSSQPLDPDTRAFMEPRFGHDFSRVRVHTSQDAARSAQAVNALAYTVGHNVVFGAGQYAPATLSGQQLIAHELTHVLQQRNDHSPSHTLSLGQPGDSYEQEADRISLSIAASEPSLGAGGRNRISRDFRKVAAFSLPSGTGVIQRQVPTGISLKEIKSFGHAELKLEEDKKKYLTNIGAVTLMQLTPAGDYTAGQKKGDCTKEFLTEVSNTCPAAAKPFCGGDRCLEVAKYGTTGDPPTGMMVTDGPDTFVDRHVARYDTSLLEGSGKSQCSVVCHQLYKYRTEPDRKYHELGAFYIIRNFKAGAFTPKGSAAPINITTGNIQKVAAPSSAPTKESFAKDIAPGLVKSGSLLDAPPVPKPPPAKTEEKEGKK